MKMNPIFNAVKEMRQDIVRNIVHVLPFSIAFSDLLENAEDAAKIAEHTIKAVLNHSEMDSHFHFTTAIGYPFETDHWMESRYSDGSFPIWYGSLDILTTIHETALSMKKQEMGIAGIQEIKVITRKRIVYDVFCEGLLIDLTKEKNHHAKLTSEHYAFTQTIGKQLHQQGYPGLLAPSARHKKGINVNVLKSEILNTPRVNRELVYQFYPSSQKIDVYENKKLTHSIF